MIRLLLCDDHPMVREGVRGMLRDQSDLEVVGEAENGLEAVEAAATLRPDVVLMDLKMPILNGASAAARIKDHDPNVKVLIVTTYDADPALLPALKNGADGCILKDAPKQALFGAVRGLMRGETPMSDPVRARLLEDLRSGLANPLTAREVEVLRLVAHGMTNQEIGRRLFISSRTVTNHLQSLFGKLGASDRTEAVTKALKRQIISLEEING